MVEEKSTTEGTGMVSRFNRRIVLASESRDAADSESHLLGMPLMGNLATQ